MFCGWFIWKLLPNICCWGCPKPFCCCFPKSAMMESLVDLALSSAADAAVWLKKSFSSAFPVVAVVAEVAAEVEDADGAAETKAAKSLLQGRGADVIRIVKNVINY